MRSITRILTGCLLVASAPAAAESITYSYDALGRLTQSKVAGGKTQNYSYDAAGNRTQTSVTTSTASLSAPSGSLFASAAGASGQISSLAAAGQSR